MYNIKNTYICKDGRVRCYYTDENGKPHVQSYPKILMVQKLGRPLEPDEEIHHMDGNPLNNDFSNLELRHKGEHQREHSTKYFDKTAICDVCHKEFIWTGKRQSNYYRDITRGRKRIITCSRSCQSYAGRQEQLGRNL